MIPAFSAAPFRDDQVCGLQDLDMLHDRAAVQFSKMVAQGPCGQRLIAQIIQYLATNRGSEGLENIVLLFDD